MNGTYVPLDEHIINCLVDGTNDHEMCAVGATRSFSPGNFEIGYTNRSFWGFVYGRAEDVSFAYPLAFEMEPVGCKLKLLYVSFNAELTSIQWPG